MPNKYKDHSKAAKDVSLGSTDSYKFTIKNNAADGTEVETSQEIKHAGTVLTKLSLKFKKCCGIKMESFETSSDGAVKGVVGYQGAAPGVDVSFGAERKESGANSVFVKGSYNQDLVNLNGSVDLLAKSLDVDAMVAYQAFLVGGKASLAQSDKSILQGFSGVVGFNWDAVNRATFEVNNEKKYSFATYVKPASDMQVSVMAGSQIAAASAAPEAIDVTVAGCFDLDNNGTSLTSTLNANARNLKDSVKFGLAYNQKLRSFAELKLSGEIELGGSNNTAFGAELNLGDLNSGDL